MRKDMYSVEEVAAQLDLHVRTVRGYIRSGRLRAVRIGKQYRIGHADLAAFVGAAGTPEATAVPGASPALEVSSVVQIDGVDRAAADRLATLVLAAANTDRSPRRSLRVQTSYQEEKARMTIVLIGGAADTAAMLTLLDEWSGDEGSLAARGSHG